jgi:hypothetical protein
VVARARRATEDEAVNDRRTPFNLLGEKETLLDFLDYLREGVLVKASGISDTATPYARATRSLRPITILTRAARVPL